MASETPAPSSSGPAAAPASGTAPKPAAASAGERDTFLDFVRNFSLLSVYLFHTFLVIGLTARWVPVMVQNSSVPQLEWPFYFQMSGFFFVGGAVLYRSSLKPGWRNLVGFWTRRLWRLLLPVVAVLAVLVVTNVVLKLTAPAGCGIHHLDNNPAISADAPGLDCTTIFPVLQFWFLPFYILLMLVTPLMARIWRTRYGQWLLAAVILTEFAADALWFANGNRSFAFYDSIDSMSVWTTAWLLGFLYADGTLRRLNWRGAAAVSIGCLTGLVLLRTVGPHAGLPTDPKPPYHFTWVLGYIFQIFAFLALRSPIVRWTTVTRLGKWFVGWLSTRVYSIYCWHAGALMIVYALLVESGARLPGDVGISFWLWRPYFVLAPLVPLVLFVWAFGRLEDVPVPKWLVPKVRSASEPAPVSSAVS